MDILAIVAASALGSVAFFAAIWLLVSAIVSRLWNASLGRAYGSDEAVVGRALPRSKVLVGMSKWGGVGLTLGADRLGLRVPKAFPWHVPVVIPFGAIERCETRDALGGTVLFLKLRGVEAPVYVRGRAVAELAAALAGRGVAAA